MRSVLKHGGQTLHFIEVEGMSRLLIFAKNYPELYKKYFIELDGHFGLESPLEIIDRFKKFFKVIAFDGIYYDIWPPEEYKKRFDNEYKQKSLKIKLISYFSKLTGLNQIFYAIAILFSSILQKVEKCKVALEYTTLIFILAIKSDSMNNEQFHDRLWQQTEERFEKRLVEIRGVGKFSRLVSLSLFSWGLA